MKTLLILVASLAAQPVLAHAGAPHSAAVADESTAVIAVLARYKSAIERLEATGTGQLFTADSAIFEGGSFEGTYANYLAHHLSASRARSSSDNVASSSTSSGLVRWTVQKPGMVALSACSDIDSQQVSPMI